MKKSWFEKFCLQIVRPQYQVVMLGFTFALVLFFGWKAIRLYRPLEQWPEVTSVVPEKIKEWGGGSQWWLMLVYISLTGAYLMW